MPCQLRERQAAFPQCTCAVGTSPGGLEARGRNGCAHALGISIASGLDLACPLPRPELPKHLDTLYRRRLGSSLCCSALDPTRWAAEHTHRSKLLSSPALHRRHSPARSR